MKTTVHANGSIVLPESIWCLAGITPGSSVEVLACGGAIQVKPVDDAPTELPVRLERRGRLLVAVPLEDVPTLTVDMVNAVIEDIRDERERRFLGHED